MNTIIPHHENKSRAASTLAQFRERASFNDLVESFINNGFAPSAAPIGGKPVTDCKAEIDALASEYEAIESLYVHRTDDDKIIVTGSQVADWIRSNYSTEEAYSAVSGTRRSYALPIAQVVLSELEELPIVPRVVEMEDSAFNSLHANLVTTAGQESVKPHDCAAWLLDYAAEKPNFTESDLVKVGIKRGRAQQMTRTYKLHKRFPRLKLLQSIANKSMKLPHKEALKDLLDVRVPKGKKDEVTEKVRKRLESGESQKSNRADKRALENAIDNAACDLVKYTLDCVQRNELDELIKTTDELAESVNELFEFSSEE